ncbi:FkbM family methyltransferase [Verrucomicrobiales bacterium BCK34]|nr:FkbM family methyltransferase [Verrucomicrobiales bacterium BCK34]
MTIKGIIACLPSYPRNQIQQLHFRKKLQNATVESEPELAVIKELVSPGQSVLDVGANFGLYTKFLSEAAGPEGHVYAFEPTFDMFRVLRNNVESLQFLNTNAFQMACSGNVAELDFYIPKRPDGTLNYYEASLEKDTIEGAFEVCRVPATSLDRFCAAHVIGKVDFIKIDVEGHEIAVLEGAEEILTRDRPKIFIEINESLTDGNHGTKVRHIIERHNYSIHVFDNGRITPWTPEQKRVNYILLPE